MTLPRSYAILLLCCMMFPAIYGQQEKVPADTARNLVRVYSVLLKEDADSAAAELQVPNVFTPNGDGVNDYFEVTTDGETVYELSLFTRTGTRIFYSLSPRIFWDGKTGEGIELPEGIYYYVIEEKSDPEACREAGFIHLFR